MIYIIYKKDSGLVEEDCSICGEHSADISKKEDDDFLEEISFQLPDDHAIKIVNPGKEFDEVRRTGKSDKATGKEFHGKMMRKNWDEMKRILGLNRKALNSVKSGGDKR